MNNNFLLVLMVLASLTMTASVAASAEVVKLGMGADPAVYQNRAVWVEADTIVHLYDLDTKQDCVISTTSGAASVAIYGDIIAWREGSTGAPTMAVYDIGSKAKTSITEHVDAYSKPSVYGNRIVWDADENVYMCDTSSTEPMWIAKGGGPDIYDNKIAYEADDGSNPQIFVYDVETGQSVKVSLGYGYLYGPHIYGDRIIWTNTYTGMGWIEMYDSASQKRTLVTDDYGVDADGNEIGCDTGSHIDLYGDRIAYAKTGSDRGVYVYDIPTARSVWIYASGNSFTQPAIYGDTIVWAVVDSGDIYACNIGVVDKDETSVISKLWDDCRRTISDLIG